jgi:HlyD family secretion protein
MTAVAWIVTGEKKDVLRVPNAALRFRPPPGTIAEVKGATNSPAPILDASGNPIPPWRAEGRPPAGGEREKWEASLSPELRERYKRAAAQMRQRSSGGGGPGAQGEGGGGPRPAPRARPEGPTTGTVYILDKAGKSAGNGRPLLRPVTVKAGISDGNQTELLEGLKEGDEIVVGLSPSSAAAASGAGPQQQPNNPFSPFGGGRRR